MPTIMASPLVLARDEPSENLEESRPKSRGLRERPDAGDGGTSVLPRNPRIAPESAEEPWCTVKPAPSKISA